MVITKAFRFLGKPFTEQLLTMRAAFMLAALVPLIRFFPFRFWRRWVDIETCVETPLDKSLDQDTLDTAREVGRIIRVASRCLPIDVVCLPQAIAAQRILNGKQINSRLYIGARRGSGSAYDFHAWLFVGDLCITGKKQHEEFKPFAHRAHHKDLDTKSATGSS